MTKDTSKINHLKPAGYVMHEQVSHSTTVSSNHTVFICVLYLSENKQRLVPLTA